jgi:hypothetical protein
VGQTDSSLAALAEDIRLMKEVIASDNFQKVLQTPEHLEAENKASFLFFLFWFCFGFLPSFIFTF